MKNLWVLAFAFLVVGCAGDDSDNEEQSPKVTYIHEIDLTECDAVVPCNDIGKVDCGSAVDGPLYFFNLQNEEIISVCGGACLAPADEQEEVCETMCPPADFICE